MNRAQHPGAGSDCKKAAKLPARSQAVGKKTILGRRNLSRRNDCATARSIRISDDAIGFRGATRGDGTAAQRIHAPSDGSMRATAVSVIVARNRLLRDPL